MLEGAALCSDVWMDLQPDLHDDDEDEGTSKMSIETGRGWMSILQAKLASLHKRGSRAVGAKAPPHLAEWAACQTKSEVWTGAARWPSDFSMEYENQLGRLKRSLMRTGSGCCNVK